MKQPVLLFYVYGIFIDLPLFPSSYKDSFKKISEEIADLLMKDPHQTEVKICVISSLLGGEETTPHVFGGELLIEVQSLGEYHENIMKREDIQAIFVKHLSWMYKEEDISFGIRNGLQL